MLLTSKGIVIQSLKYGENSLISKVVSEERGLVRLISNRVKSRKNKQANFFQPLSAIYFTCYISNKTSIHRVKELSFNTSITQPTENVSINSLRFFIAEFLFKVVKEEEQNRSLYTFLELKVNLLYKSDTDLSLFHIQFLSDFFEQLGIQPDIDSQKTYFDLQEGCSTNEKPPHDDYYIKSQIEPYSKLISQQKLTKTEKSALLNFLLRYYNVQLGGTLTNIKSKPILEAVFS